MAAYEDMIHAIGQPEARWYVVPADHKWFTQLLVAGAMIEALEGLDLQFPEIEGAALKDLQKVRASLVAEERGKRSSK